MSKEALEDSIAHWERLLSFVDNEAIGSDHCALCGEYLFPKTAGHVHCLGCPVFKVTGKQFCEGTPYTLVPFFLSGRKQHPELVQAELDFLKSLRRLYEAN